MGSFFQVAFGGTFVVVAAVLIKTLTEFIVCYVDGPSSVQGA